MSIQFKVLANTMNELQYFLLKLKDCRLAGWNKNNLFSVNLGFLHAWLTIAFLKMGHTQPLFLHSCSFQTAYRIKTLNFSGIQIRNNGVEDERSDHTTTAHA